MKGLKFFLSVVLLILLAIPVVNAVKTTRTVTISGGFVADADANIPYSKTFTFKAPDGISELYYAKVIVRADMTTTDTKVYVKVGNDFCNPSYYYVPTNEKNYFMIFDCTDVFHGQGEYTAGFQADKNIKNVYVEWEFTYLNNPPVSVASIGGTEYSTGEPSRIVLQILDNEGNPINNGACFTTVRNSDDVVVVDNQSLNYIPDSNGLYYYEFVVELPIGVYSTDSYCSLGGVNVYSGDTFHVAKWAEDIKDVKNITGQARISFVGGTEYTQDEPVGIRTQFLKADGSPVTPYDPDGGGTCEFDLFSPNHTQIFDDQNMTFINNSNGIYAYDWNETGKDLGVYVVDVYCHKTGLPAFSAWGSSTFHVSRWAQGIMNMSINGTSVNYYDLIFAGATEYQVLEEGTFVVQFFRTVAGSQKPVNDADWCRGNIYFPNMTLWQSQVNMSYLQGSNGLYFNTTKLPNVLGVYTMDAICKKGGINAYASDTFHVAPWIQTIINATTNITFTLGNITFNTTELEGLIKALNTSVMNKLYGMQDEITSINDTIKFHNQTVMWKLYRIQDEIASVNVTLYNATLNITIPASMNLTNTSINEIGEDVIIKMLEHARILNKRVVNFKNNEYCISDKILRHNITYNYCIGDRCRWLKDIMDEECNFGCDPKTNECIPNPAIRIVWVIGIIMFIIVMIYIFRKWIFS